MNLFSFSNEAGSLSLIFPNIGKETPHRNAELGRNAGFHSGVSQHWKELLSRNTVAQVHPFKTFPAMFSNVWKIGS